MARTNIGIVNPETWGFFSEIYEDLQAHYKTSVFDRHDLSLPILGNKIPLVTQNYALKRFMRRNDLVFFEWASSLLAAASRLPKCCKIVTRLHRFEMYVWANETNWDHVDKIILVSKAKQQEFSARFPTHASKTCVVVEGLSLERFSSHSRVFSGNIGTLCHIQPRKRVYELVLDFYQLQERRSDLTLHIAGGPDPWAMDYHVALQRLVDKLDIRDKIIFHGPTDEPELWYRNIDIFVSHSYSEGLQVSPMEAMATGCYCLSHWWDGADELLPERNLYYTGNELNEKILAYCQLADEEKDRQRALMQSIARDRFDIKQTVREMRSIIESTV